MVLLALSVLAVTLLFLAIRHKLYHSSLQLSKPTAQHEEKQRAKEPRTSDSEKEKGLPAFKLDLSEKVEDKDSTNTRTFTDMKDPFEDEGSQVKAIHSMPPPSLVPSRNGKHASPVGLMPPPSRPIPQTPPPGKSQKSSTLTPVRTPPSTASTLRAPPARTPLTTSLLAPSTSTIAPSSRNSKKVLLEPGHSPLDWAHLTTNPPSATFLRGADVPPNLIRVPPSLLKYHNGRKDKETGELKDAWGVWQGKVYNLTPYMKFHPGGPDQLMRGAGNTKAGQLFNETHSWVSWDNMMGECLVGILVSENEVQQADTMEEMD